MRCKTWTVLKQRITSLFFMSCYVNVRLLLCVRRFFPSSHCIFCGFTEVIIKHPDKTYQKYSALHLIDGCTHDIQQIVDLIIAKIFLFMKTPIKTAINKCSRTVSNRFRFSLDRLRTLELALKSSFDCNCNWKRLKCNSNRPVLHDKLISHFSLIHLDFSCISFDRIPLRSLNNNKLSNAVCIFAP